MKKDIPKHPHSGFMNTDIFCAKHLNGKYESSGQHGNSAREDNRYCNCVNHYNFFLEQSKTSDLSRIVAENKGETKALLYNIKIILHKSLDGCHFM